MAFINDANNLNWAFICQDIAGADSAGPVFNEPSDLQTGEVVVVNENNTHITTALSAGDQFKIIQEQGGELIISPLFTFKSATGLDGLAATNAAQQVTTIGSNGTTAVGLAEFGVADDTAAAAAVGNSYYVLIEKQDNDEASRSGYAPAITAQAKLTNPAGFTNAELLHIRLAEQLAESIRANDALEASTPSVKGPKYVQVKVKVVASGATAAGEAVAVNHGSKTITFANSGSSLDASVVAGAYVSIAGDIYRMATSHASGVVTLDRPFAGITNAAVASGTGAAQVFALTAVEAAAATGIGLELTATDQHTFNVERDRVYSQSRFNTRFAKDGENVGATITVGTQASEGNNDFRTILYDLYHSAGNAGQRWNSDTPAVARRSAPSFVSATNDGFACISIKAEAENKTLLSNGNFTQTIRLYIENEDNAGVRDNAGYPATILNTVFGAGLTGS